MKTLLVIGYVWPEPTSSAAGSRMMQLLEFFLAKSYKITFATTAVKTDSMADLAAMEIQLEKIELNSPSFDTFLQELQPDVVLFDRFMMEEQFGWRVSTVCPKALKILDTEDLHFVRKARTEAFKKKIPEQSAFVESELAKREIASIYRCDLSLIISMPEIEILTTFFNVPENLLFYLPFMIPVPSEAYISKVASFEERQDFVSIGNFRHEPNWDAVLNLKQNIWPLIRKEIPEARLNIYGAYAPQKAYELHKPAEGFLVHGKATSAVEVLSNARLLLAPLRFGAGLKGKFMDAMLSGTPSTTTRIGCEGMTDENSWNGSIADNPVDFSRVSVQLYQNVEQWRLAQIKGFEILKNKFSKELHENRLNEKLNYLEKNLETHRLDNFTGKMLMHHSLNSSMYMSRFIEEKNRNAELLQKKSPVKTGDSSKQKTNNSTSN